MRLISKLYKIDSRFKTTLNRFRETMSTPPLDLNRSHYYSFIPPLLILLFLLPLSAFSQNIIEIDGDGNIPQESDGSYNVNAGDLFYDDGGVSDPHSSQSFSIKFCTDDNTKTIGLKFNVIDLGLGSKLTFKNGSNQDLAPTDISRDENGSVVVVSSDDNCININFEGQTFPGNGWEAEVVLSAPCDNLDLNVSNVSPNKDAFGNIIANVNEPIQINQISGLSSGVQYNYTIDYGNGNSMVETGLSFPIAIPAYTASGIYQLQLTVKDIDNASNLNMDGTVNYCEYDLNIPVAVGLASSGVAEIDILEDIDNDGVVNLECGATTTDIHADFVEVKGTTDYKVDEILYKPFETDGTGNILEPVGTGYVSPFTIGEDDVWSTPKEFPSDFKFCFYSEEYQWFRMSSNGALALLKTNLSGQPINNANGAPISLSVTEPDATYDIYPALPGLFPGDSWDYLDNEEDTLGGLNYSSTSNPDPSTEFESEGDQLVNAIMLLQDLNPNAAKHSEFLITDYQTDSNGVYEFDTNGFLILENDFGIMDNQDFITLNQGFYDSLSVGDEILFDFDNQSIGAYAPIPTSPLRIGKYFVVEKITGTTQIRISNTSGGLPITFQNTVGTNEYISRTQVFYTEDKMGKFGYKLVNQGSENNRALVMTIYDVPHYFINDFYAHEALDELYSDPDNPSNVTFQMVLYETTNVIELFVENRPEMSGEAAVVNRGQALIGIQGNVNDPAFQNNQFKVVNVDDQDTGNFDILNDNNGNANWDIKRRAWRFTPDSGTSNTTVKWFTIDASGTETIIPGEVTNTLSNQPEGDYKIEVTYESCDNTAAGGTTIFKAFSVAPSTDVQLTVTAEQSQICSNTPAKFLLDGVANAVVDYEIEVLGSTTTTSGSVTLRADGKGEVVFNDTSNDTTLSITLVSTSDCSDSPNISFTISTGNFITTPIITPSIDPVCSGGDADFNILAAPNTILTFTLDGGATTQTVSTDSNGEVTVTVSSIGVATTMTITGVEEPNGCSDLNLSLSSTITVTSPIVPAFTQINPVCEGATLNPLPSQSLNGVNGSWSPAINNSATTEYTFTPDTGVCAEEVTMTIVVNELVVPNFTQIDAICAGDILTPLPTQSINGITGSWAPAINNTVTTEYTFTPDIGLCAEEFKMTIVVNAPIVPSFDQVAPICEFDIMLDLPILSNEGISGTWSPALNNKVTTEYTFTPDNGECALLTTMTILVNELVTPTFDAIDPVCIGDVNPLPSSSIEGVTGTWSPDFNDKATTTYTFIPNNNQCVDTLPVAMEVIVKPLSECIEYELFPKFFTPNGNGQNDTWLLYKLTESNQSQSYAVVYDRYGKELITLTPSKAEWDGTYKGNPMPSSDYWVVLYYFNEELGQMVQHTGHFSLKR